MDTQMSTTLPGRGTLSSYESNRGCFSSMGPCCTGRRIRSPLAHFPRSYQDGMLYEWQCELAIFELYGDPGASRHAVVV